MKKIVKKMLDWRTWLRSIAAAFIGGGAGAVTGSIGASLLDPKMFNLTDGMANTLKLALGCFIVNGLLNAFFYLRQSPVPPEIEVTEESTTTTNTQTTTTTKTPATPTQPTQTPPHEDT